MLYIERKPGLALRRFVRSLWYASTPFVEHRRDRILPSGCAHIVVSLSQDFLTDCPQDRAGGRVCARPHREAAEECDAPVAAGVMPTGVWR